MQNNAEIARIHSLSTAPPHPFPPPALQADALRRGKNSSSLDISSRAKSPPATAESCAAAAPIRAAYDIAPSSNSLHPPSLAATARAERAEERRVGKEG